MMKKILVTLTILAICFVAYRLFIQKQSMPIYAEEYFKWNDSRLYDKSLYGRVITVEFIVVDSYNSGRACYLDVSSSQDEYFTAVILSLIHI